MGRRYGKQDARNSVLDLNSYGADDMIADLGNHRHTNLPLSGAVNLAPPPLPNAKKFGLAAAKTAAKNDDLASAWGALYDPEMDEERDDGLGTGQAHRLGFNFRPNQNVLAGRGRGRRSRSMSPKRPRGRGLVDPGGPGFSRGRGHIEPGMLGIPMGTRPPRRPSAEPYLSKPGNLSIRHIRPRVSTPAMDDIAAPAYGGGNINNGAMVARQPRAPVMGDVKDTHVGHWWGGRLTVNRDVDKFFSPRQLQQAAAEEQAPPDHDWHTKSTISNASFKPVQSDLGGLGESKYAPKNRTNMPPSRNELIALPSIGEEWVKPPPPPTPGAVIAPTQRRHVTIPSKPSSMVLSEAASEPRNGPLSPDRATPPASPFGRLTEGVPVTVEDFQARIDELEDRLGSASVLLSVYSEELDEIIKEEVAILKKLDVIQATKKGKEERVTKQRVFMEEKTVTLKDLRERRNEFVAEMERLRIEALEKERLARLELEEKERIAKEELGREKARIEREKQSLAVAQLQDAYIRLQIERNNEFKERLAREQAGRVEKKEHEEETSREEEERIEERTYQERIEQEKEHEQRRLEEHAEQTRLETERLEFGGLEMEHLEKDYLEKERLANRRIAMQRLQRIQQERSGQELAEKQEKDKRIAEQERPEKQRMVLEQIEKDNLEAERKFYEKGRIERNAERQRIEKSRLAKPFVPQPTQERRPLVLMKSPQVFSPYQRDEARDNEAFKLSNPVIPECPYTFPYKVRIVLRPIVDHDPMELAFTHTDQPGQMIRRTLIQMLGPGDTKYIMGLDSCANFIDEVTHRFYGKMASVLGGC